MVSTRWAVWLGREAYTLEVVRGLGPAAPVQAPLAFAWFACFGAQRELDWARYRYAAAR
jgi:hypothetical protein